MITWNIAAIIIITSFVLTAIALSIMLYVAGTSGYDDTYVGRALSRECIDMRGLPKNDWEHNIKTAIDGTLSDNIFLIVSDIVPFMISHDPKSIVDSKHMIADYGISVIYKSKWGGPELKETAYVLRTENLVTQNILTNAKRCKLLGVLDSFAKKILLTYQEQNYSHGSSEHNAPFMNYLSREIIKASN